MAYSTGLAGRIAQAFLHSKLTPLLMAAFLGIGVYAAWLTPKEEDPQIRVPLADIFVRYPGATPEEVESRIAAPMERLLSNIEGIEYVYSTSTSGQAVLTARYLVGADIERSYVRLYNEIMKHMDQMPRGASMPLVKTRSVDDVPVLTLTLHADPLDEAGYTDYDLRRLAHEMRQELKAIEGVAAVKVHGGRERQVRVALAPNRLAAYSLDLPGVAQQLQAANAQLDAGSYRRADREVMVETGRFFASAADVRGLVVGVHEGQPVYLGSVADVTDGPAEPARYVAYGLGAGGAAHPPETVGPAAPGLAPGAMRPAVTLAVAKVSGTDAMTVAGRALDKVEALRGTLIPAAVTVTTTRDYGETASEKVAELLLHLAVAIGTVMVIVSLAMGWRGGLVVFLSVPISFALTLFVYYFFGYTLNRITLFALIFVTGIVVDDSIIVAENMERHFRMRRLPVMQAALAAIDEVGNPTILATLTVIAAVLPMAFVSGLMGPYMSPMPIGASLAMMFSLIVALVITPYLSFRLLEKDDHDEGGASDYRLEDTWIYRAYAASMRPLLERRGLRWGFLAGTAVLLFASVSLFYFRVVAVKMLPYDDKNELQVIVDMPEGTTLERTNAVTRELAAFLMDEPVVRDVQTYAGDAAPVNLNGLVRHYDLRRAPHMGDVQVNLVHERERQSHAIAKDLRGPLQAIGARHDANIKIAEVPPGPPVRATLVAEVYGPTDAAARDAARQVRAIFASTDGVVDVDWAVEAPQPKQRFVIDKEKAMRAGVPAQRITEAMRLALGGQDVTTMRLAREREPVGVHVRLAEASRSSADALQNVHVQSQTGALLPVVDLVTVEATTRAPSIDRKNQLRVVYVTADVAGAVESPVYAMLDMQERLEQIDTPAGTRFQELFTAQPFTTDDVSLKWDGEWRITYKVFRDLGIAFGVVLLIIYILIVGWFQDLTVPLVMMVAIPLSLVGIVGLHWALGAFFTATSMIGFIALAGIMVRNSVLLIDFINLRLADDVPIDEAVIEAGAVRTRPILLTAGTVVIGAFVILFDPVFQGLAISLMGGAIASTLLTLLIVPLIYFMVEQVVDPAIATESAAPTDEAATDEASTDEAATDEASTDEAAPSEDDAPGDATPPAPGGDGQATKPVE